MDNVISLMEYKAKKDEEEQQNRAIKITWHISESFMAALRGDVHHPELEVIKDDKNDL